MAKRKLTEKQKRFVQEYLVDLNATAAAQRAGYKDPNIGRQLITKNNVSSAIQEAIDKRQTRVEITQDRVLQELAAIAFAKGTDYASIVSGIVMMNDTEELTQDQKAAIVAIKQTKEGVEAKLGNKLKALELLGRHLGVFSGRQADGELMDEPYIDDPEEAETQSDE